MEADQWRRCTKCGEAWAWPASSTRVGTRCVRERACGGPLRELTDAELAAAYVGAYDAVEAMPL